MVNGNMVAEHAAMDYPADSGGSGAMTFIVGENGIVYQADLGDATLEKFLAINSFNRGEGWTKVEELGNSNAGPARADHVCAGRSATNCTFWLQQRIAFFRCNYFGTKTCFSFSDSGFPHGQVSDSLFE